MIILLIILFCFISINFAYSQTDIKEPDLSVPTLITTEYFGPNAFPIPDMLDGKTQKNLTAEVSGSYHLSKLGDNTYDISAKIIIPLFTERVNLTIWAKALYEWYTLTPQSIEYRRLDKNIPLSNSLVGDIYLSIDIYALTEGKYWPGISCRAALKTASGGGFGAARYYDSAGYFFDASFGKSFILNQAIKNYIRIVVSSGFLCWQTDNARQNDAIMYGIKAEFGHKQFRASATYGGYWGWERNHDHPMSLKADINYNIQNFEPFFKYQYGIQDYPFHSFELGLRYYVDILKKPLNSKKESKKSTK